MVSRLTEIEGKREFELVLARNSTPRHGDVQGSGGIAPRILKLGSRWK